MQCQLTIIVTVRNVLVEAARLTVPWPHNPGLCSRCMRNLLASPWATAHHCLTDLSLTTFLCVQERQSAAKARPKRQDATAEAATINCDNDTQATSLVRRIGHRWQAPGPLHPSMLPGARKMTCTRSSETALMLAAWVSKAYMVSPQFANQSVHSN